MFTGINYKTRFGLALIGVFILKAILSVIMQTGFDPLLVSLNSIFLVTGIIFIFWGLYGN
jgi:hypothetical protein